jgi:hypothetical protein
MRLSFPRKNVSYEAFFRGAPVPVWYDSDMPLLYSFTILFGLQFVFFHYLAERFELYWRYAWLDMPMHLFGGVFIMLALWSLARIGIIPRSFTSSWRLPLVLLLIMLLWEAFGVYRYGGLKPDFWSDGIIDIVFGTIGIVAGYYLARAITKI